MHYENFCKVLAHIEANPLEWDQDSYYECCFAAHAARISGCESQSVAEVILAAEKFLDVEACTAHGLFSVFRTLEDFQRIRLVGGYANFAKAA